MVWTSQARPTWTWPSYLEVASVVRASNSLVDTIATIDLDQVNSVLAALRHKSANLADP